MYQPHCGTARGHGWSGRMASRDWDPGDWQAMFLKVKIQTDLCGTRQVQTEVSAPK